MWSIAVPVPSPRARCSMQSTIPADGQGRKIAQGHKPRVSARMAAALDPPLSKTRPEAIFRERAGATFRAPGDPAQSIRARPHAAER